MHILTVFATNAWGFCRSDGVAGSTPALGDGGTCSCDSRGLVIEDLPPGALRSELLLLAAAGQDEEDRHMALMS